MHRSRNLILLCLLVVLPLIAAVVAARFLLPADDVPVLARMQTQRVETPKPPVTRKVVVTTRDLPVGRLLADGDLTGLDLTTNEVRPSHIVVQGAATFAQLHGHAMRVALPAGAPVTRSDLIGPGQRGFLAAVLRPGTRAVTIGLGKNVRHAGLIDPGDRVDVILTAKLRDSTRSGTSLTRTILEDVRVVAVDRRTEADPAPQQGKKRQRTEIVTATLEVMPAQADRLAHARHSGSLSVAVRSLAGSEEPVRSNPVDLEQLLAFPAPSQTDEEPGVQQPRKKRWKKVRVLRGSEVTEHKFSGAGGNAAGVPGAQ